MLAKALRKIRVSRDGGEMGRRPTGRPRITNPKAWETKDKNEWVSVLCDHDSSWPLRTESQWLVLSRALVPLEYEVWVREFVHEVSREENGRARKVLESLRKETAVNLRSLGVTMASLLIYEQARLMFEPKRKELHELLKAADTSLKALERYLGNYGRTAKEFALASEGSPAAENVETRDCSLKILKSQLQILKSLDSIDATFVSAGASSGSELSMRNYLITILFWLLRWYTKRPWREGIAELLTCGARALGLNISYSAKGLEEIEKEATEGAHLSSHKAIKDIKLKLKMYRGYTPRTTGRRKKSKVADSK
jgi:hypothetical protein